MKMRAARLLALAAVAAMSATPAWAEAAAAAAVGEAEPLADAQEDTPPAQAEEVAVGGGGSGDEALAKELQDAKDAHAALAKDLEAAKEELRKKEDELKMAGAALKDAGRRAQEMHDSNAANSRAASEKDEAARAACDSKVQAAEEKATGLEKRLEKAKEEVKRATSEAGKSAASCADSRKFEEEAVRLRKQLEDAKSASSDCSGPMDKLKKELEREKARHDEETARLRASADEGAQTLMLIAWRRGSEHAARVSEEMQKFYEQTVVPSTAELGELSQQKFDELKVLAGPHWDAFEQATVPARAWLFEQLDAVQPVYEEHAKPHVETLSAAASDLMDKAPGHVESFRGEAYKRFFVFREQAIKTVRANKQTEEFAETIIDAALIAVAFIAFMYLVGPISGLILAIAIAVLLLPFRLVAYFLCCGCCRGSRRRPTATQPARQSGKI